MKLHLRLVFVSLHILVFANFLGQTSKMSGRPLQVLLSDSQVQIQVYTFGSEVTPSSHFRPPHIHVFTNFLGQIGCNETALLYFHPFKVYVGWVALKLHYLLFDQSACGVALKLHYLLFDQSACGLGCTEIAPSFVYW